MPSRSNSTRGRDKRSGGKPRRRRPDASLRLLIVRLDLEAAPRPVAALAAFAHGRLHELREQGLDRVANVGLAMDRRGQETSESPDAPGPVRSLDFVRRAQLLQQRRGPIDASLRRAARPGPLAGEAAADHTHDVIELPLRKALA